MNTHPNESGALQRLSKRESRLINIQAHIIAWWTYQRDFRYPVVYRYVRKVLLYIGVLE